MDNLEDMNTNHLSLEYVILGGGIAGLTTALALKNVGINATVVEASPEFKPVGAGIVLAENALKAYRYLGIIDELYEYGNLVSDMIIYDQFGKPLNKIQTKSMAESWENLAIHRVDLHQVLLSNLNSTNIIKGKRTKELIHTPEGHRIIFEDKSIIAAKYLIVAEGIHSVVRRQIIPQSVERYSGCTCWRGITKVCDLKINEASETWGRNGRFGIVPLRNGSIYWFAVKNSKPDNPQLKQFTTYELLETFREYHDPISAVIYSTPDDQVIWNDIYDLKPINQYAFGNLVLIGDAAHATTPNMGQGACQAIEDAVVLARCINEIGEVTDAFSKFENRRLKRTHFVVNQSWNLGKIAQLESNLLIVARNFLFRSLPESYYKKQLQKINSFSF